MHQIIYIHKEAPSKPHINTPCNGCGICCLAELCPYGMLRFLRIKGPCPALEWEAEHTRYACGFLKHAKNQVSIWWIKRSIAAGKGCDSTASIKDLYHCS